MNTMTDNNNKGATAIGIIMFKLRDILKKRGKRTLKAPWKQAYTTIAVAMALFHFTAAGLGTIPTRYILITHLGFILTIIFLSTPASSRSDLEKPTVIDILFVLLSIASTAYLGIYLKAIYDQMGMATTSDIIFGGITILLILEACRRTVGFSLTIVAVAFLIYGYFGRYMPGVFEHIGYSISDMINILYLTDEGVFGVALQTSATYIILFIIFGSIMQGIQMSKFLTDFALGVAGSMVGGPAKVATVASGLLGTVSGSVSGNVATTGIMTIPLMKSVGYRPSYAGAVECVASAGGQLMPPVMGAAAFLMAQFLGVPYSSIIISAAIPALLYYICVWTAVDLRARKRNLQTISKDQVPPLRDTFKNYGHLAIPLLVLIYLLVIKRYSPIYSAFLAIILAVVVSFFRSHTRLTVKKLINAFESAVKNALSVAIACAVAGIIIGIITLTGFGLVISLNIIRLSFGSILLTLILGMVASLILGMGLPTTACYIVTALTVAPALVRMGVEPMAAHFFVFYFAILSTVTPPVALSSFVAAGLAKADPVETALAGFRLAIAGFIIPYMIVYKPELLILGFGWAKVMYAVAISVIGIMMVAVVNEGFFMGTINMIGRLALTAGVFGLLLLDWRGDLIAGPIIAAVVFWQMHRKKQHSQVLSR
ncbi:MAG: TRAP transporter permease [Deltaproteobacteria bacterium]|nr:TRAP transporter permease [Deltaproteobacteria bacterium]